MSPHMNESCRHMRITRLATYERVMSPHINQSFRHKWMSHVATHKWPEARVGVEKMIHA